MGQERLIDLHVQVIHRFLPKMAEVVYMLQSSHPPAFIVADLDGDGQEEMVAAYRCQGEMYLMILKKNRDWYKIAEVKGTGYNITDMLAAPVTHSNQINLIIGWQVGSIWSELDIVQWTTTGYKHVLRKKYYYSKLEIVDMPDDTGKNGKYEVALWSHDTGESYKVEVYKWQHDELVSAKEYYRYYFPKVMNYYEGLLKKAPASPVYLYYLADAQAKSARPEQALKTLEMAQSFPYPYPSKELISQYITELQAIPKNHSIPSSITVNGEEYLLDCKQADVNRDGVKDRVLVVAEKITDKGDRTFVEQVSVLVQDGRTGLQKRIPIPTHAGYHPTLFLGDFTGDKRSDILVVINTGENDGLLHGYLYTFVDDEYALIFHSDTFLAENKYMVRFRDGYHVHIENPVSSKSYLLDISDKKQSYLDEIYKSDTTLKKPIIGKVAGIKELFPTDYERNGTYTLQINQNILGQDDSDCLAVVETILKWEGVAFTPNRQQVAISGKVRS
ncbi:hypothetical protein [Brevibacillus daliensis]|uniref:hypothetical protein n=1 Tax=Brevibacillus daliensis TaxID=2892995 RepID=UPI001E4B258A|nr:hypothetical protein [Brevibacillus daliensis]